MMTALLLTLALAAGGGGWERVGVIEGVVVEKREDRGLWMRCSRRVDVPYEQMKDAFLTLDFGNWVESLSEWRILERGRDRAVAYGRHTLPFPLMDRDYVVDMRWRERRGRLRLESTPAPDRLPLRHGAVRMRSLDDIWVLERVGDQQTLITYVYRADLGGDIPRFLQEAGMKSEGPATFQRLIEAASRRR